MLTDKSFTDKLHKAQKLSNVKSKKYDAIFYAGGHGAMFDLPDNKDLQKVTSEIYEKGGVVSAVCHGPAGLINVKLKNGDYLVKGKNIAAFTNDEEAAVQKTDLMPFLLETKLIERGALHTKADIFKPHVVTSERLVTGQNPASAKGVAESVKALLKGL